MMALLAGCGRNGETAGAGPEDHRQQVIAAACSAGAPCPSGQRCDNGVCVLDPQPCGEDKPPCSTTEVCTNGTCQPPENGFCGTAGHRCCGNGCRGELLCDEDNVCKACGRKDGDPCCDFNTCYNGLTCDGVCKAPEPGAAIDTVIDTAAATLDNGQVKADIPAGTFPPFTRVHVEAVAPEDIGDEFHFVGQPYTFDPPGPLAKNVTVTFTQSANLLSDEDPVVFWSKDDGTWDELTPTVIGKTFTVQTSHFSTAAPSGRSRNPACKRLDPNDPVACPLVTPCNCYSGQTGVCPVSFPCGGKNPAFVGMMSEFCSGVEVNTMTPLSGMLQCYFPIKVCQAVIPAALYPQSTSHINMAKAGTSAFFTIDRGPQAKARRRASLAGKERQMGGDLDEYPPAMFKEGGAGSSVTEIAAADNRGSGSCFGNQLRSLPNGTTVMFVVQ